MRIRQIKYYAGVYYIALKKSDVIDLKLNHNDEVDIDDIVKIQKQSSRKKKV